MEYLTNHFSYACQNFETIKNPRYSLRTRYFQGKFNLQSLSPEYCQPIRPSFDIYYVRKLHISAAKKKKERKEIEKKMLVGRSSNLRIPYSAPIVLKELF